MCRGRLPSLPVRPARVVRDRRGASTVEYGLILALIVLMMFGALMEMGGITKDMWNEVAEKVTSAK